MSEQKQFGADNFSKYLKETLGVNDEEFAQRLISFEKNFNKLIDEKGGLDAPDIVGVFKDNGFTNAELITMCALAEIRFMSLRQNPSEIDEFGFPDSPLREAFSYIATFNEELAKHEYEAEEN